MAKRQPSVRAWALSMVCAATAACGSDGDAATKPAETLPPGCARLVEPGADDTTTVQTALIEAKDGDVLCLAAGTFRFSKELSLTVPNVTVRGMGPGPEDVVLDFSDQTQEGDDGMQVTSDGFTIEKLWIKNTPGNGIVVTGARDVTFRNLKVSWDSGSVETNGAYAVYPVKSDRVLIEDVEVTGAIDAGIYVGQCTNVIVRRNHSHGNVIGIETENTTTAEVYGNLVEDNSTGFLVDLLPNLEKKDAFGLNLHDNISRNNNHVNFAPPGTFASITEVGVGIEVVAPDEVELHVNTIEDNDAVGISIVSWAFVKQFVQGVTDFNIEPDPLTDEYPEMLFVHDNTFSNNGTAPTGLFGLLGVNPVEDVQWDGAEKTGGAGVQLCLGTTNLPSFRNNDAIHNFLAPSTDTTPFECTRPALPSVTF